ncbi:hypothetical protein AUF78_15280 [archaeon 13_1_20CM_2_51_12]|nr:MAG: hypothetical protein AUF78_15280 [archaeon 13_1_20CM_2_51_12]
MFSKFETFIVAMCRQPVYGQPEKCASWARRWFSILAVAALSQKSAVWLEAGKVGRYTKIS